MQIAIIPENMKDAFESWIGQHWVAFVTGKLKYGDLVEALPPRTLGLLVKARQNTQAKTPGTQYVMALFQKNALHAEIDLDDVRDRLQRILKMPITQDNISSVPDSSGKYVPVLCYGPLTAYRKRPTRLTF